jgi:beta-RFAP synthase
MKKIQIKTPSRLHLGFLDLRGDFGRKYGSVGVAIKKPNFFIEAEISNSLKVEGRRREEALEYAKHFLKKFNLEENIRIKVIESIPKHIGLGSGTQLALGIGFAISKLFQLELSVEHISEIMQRGKVSGIGTYAFKLGGFLIDGGKKIDNGEKIPPLLFHHFLPKNWFWIVGIPKIEKNREKGLSGGEEKNAFQTLPKPKKEFIATIFRLTWEKMVPAVIENDIKEFGEAITQLDKKTGKCFSKKQEGGGIYFSKKVERGVKFLLENGAYGAGQSSWGPSFYGLVKEEKNAIELQNKLKQFLGSEGEVFMTNTENKGVKVGKIKKIEKCF